MCEQCKKEKELYIELGGDPDDDVLCEECEDQLYYSYTTQEEWEGVHNYYDGIPF